MKKIFFLLLISTSLFAQNAPLRIDSLEINDKDVTGIFDNQFTTDNMKLSLDTLLIFTASDSSDTLIIFDDGTDTYLESENTIKTGSTEATDMTVSDSLKLSIWIRSLFLSVGGDSIGVIYKDTVDGKVDTVYIIP